MKTIEEKAREYAEVAFAKALKAPWPEAKKAFAEAYIAGATDVLAGCQWHDADKVEPEVGQEVVWHIKLKTPRGTWIDGYISDRYDGEYKPEHAWHWMPIPELPKHEYK